MDFFDDVVIPVVVILGGMAVLWGAIFCVVNEFTRYECNSYHKITGKEVRYNNFDSCYINTSVGWQRWDEYKARAVASEGLKK